VAAQSAAAEANKNSVEGDTQSLLLFNNNDEEQFAIPMGVVSRIERIQPSQLIRVGDQQVLRYQDSTLPLLCLEDHVQVKPRLSDEGMSAIVFDFGGRELGLVAPVLHDIRTVTAMIDDKTLSEPGVVGSMVIDDVMTRLVDVYELSAKAHPEWATLEEKQPDESDHQTQVLLAEDSKFFRNQVKKYLEGQGYCTIEAEDGQEGWELLEADPGRFDLVVTDIQMPRMNGFELCEKIKQNSRTSHLPVIALTSLAGDEDMKRGEACGVDDYQIKMDREKLLDAVERLKLSVSKPSAKPSTTASPNQRRVLQPV
jgi:two-component system chemotaxis sensor kinase CheA